MKLFSMAKGLGITNDVLAAVFGVSVRTLYRWHASGGIPKEYANRAEQVEKVLAEYAKHDRAITLTILLESIGNQ